MTSNNEVCGECSRDATHIVNDVAFVCDYHARGAMDEGFLVRLITELTEGNNVHNQAKTG